MEKGLFAYILRYSRPQQIFLLVVTVLSFPFYYFSLDLPKTIVNEAIDGTEFPVDLNLQIAGLQFSLGALEQVPYLIFLCMLFLVLVLINGGFKLFINIYRGTLGERMLRRLRLQLVDNIMRFPLARFRSTSQGELVSMVNQETEPLGGFIGEAFSLPLYQGGMLLTILAFMFVQDWKLGLAAIALYPLQAWLIPKLQARVNQLNRQRTVRMRNLAENLGEVVAGINEIHVNDNKGFYRDHFSKLLGGIFHIRVKIYRMKFFIKFLNNSIAQLTPFLFFLIGGLLVIRGDLSIGALVAALAAYKDLSPPWKELLAWYQGQADARMRYQILIEQFEIQEEASDEQPEYGPAWLQEHEAMPVAANNVSLKRADGIQEVDGVTLSVGASEWVSLVGAGNSGKHALAQMFARLVSPSRGQILLADQNIARLPRMTTGRAVGYVGHDSYLFGVSIRDNLLLSLKYQPQEHRVEPASADEDVFFRNWQEEARLSGNSDVDNTVDWVDHRCAGVESPEQLMERLGDVLRIVDVEDDMVRYSLSRTIDPETRPELAESILQARRMFKERVSARGMEQIVEFLDPDVYNDNATLAENILFGVSSHESWTSIGMAENPVIRELLRKHGLSERLDEFAISAASTIVELFSGLPPGHEFFDRYSFVEAADVPRLKRILGSLDEQRSIESLDTQDRGLLRSLPFSLIRARHRLGVLQEEDKVRIVSMRHELADATDPESRLCVEFFDPDRYNASAPLVENIIFGRVVFGRLGAEDQVYSLILEVLRELNLIAPLLGIALDVSAGLAGGLLPVSQRQKLLLARALLKQPRLLIINEGLEGLDDEEVERILPAIRQQYPRLTLFWVDNKERFLDAFDQVAHIKSGRIVEVRQLTPGSGAEQGDDQETQTITIHNNEKLDLIRSIPIFRPLDESHQLLLASKSRSEVFPAGECLFRQGDPADCLYIIISGEADVLISDAESLWHVSEYGRHEVIGELGILSDEPRTATVEAATELTVLRLDKEDFLELLQENSTVGLQILQVVAHRLVNTNQELSRELRARAVAQRSGMPQKEASNGRRRVMQ